MRTIHISRAGAQLGVFSDDEFRAGIASGRFAAGDFGWTEGMAEWKPLSTFPEFGAAGAPALPASITAPPDFAATTPVRTGLPWENRPAGGNFFTAFSDTLVMVLTRPDEAFRIMRQEGGLSQALLYVVIGGSIGGIVSALFSLALQSFGFMTGEKNAMAMLASWGVGIFVAILMIPLLVVVGIFIASAIIHLCLMVVGGANKSFETTFRVLAYAHGSSAVIQMLPVCGGLIAGIWGIVVSCIGLARAHETTTGRALLAILLPVILCCGLGVVLVVFFGVGAALLHQNQ